MKTKDGGVYRSNRRLLNRTTERFPEITDFDPNILADDSKYTAETQTEHSPQKVNENDNRQNIPTILMSQKPDSSRYVTRSAREIKSNTLYDNKNWVRK